PYLAAATAGSKLASRKAAVGVAIAGAVVVAGATLLAGLLAPNFPQWPWWVTLTVALPVYIGTSQRDRIDALRNARLAAEEARRAKESEAREAALIERGRIAREIHDVLGHSLSGIALQLDMADALHDSGRQEEATAALPTAPGSASSARVNARRCSGARCKPGRPATAAGPWSWSCPGDRAPHDHPRRRRRPGDRPRSARGHARSRRGCDGRGHRDQR